MLAGCEEGAKFNPFKQLNLNKKPAEASEASGKSSVKLVERDVEAPEVFPDHRQGALGWAAVVGRCLGGAPGCERARTGHHPQQ